MAAPNFPLLHGRRLPTFVPAATLILTRRKATQAPEGCLRRFATIFKIRMTRIQPISPRNRSPKHRHHPHPLKQNSTAAPNAPYSPSKAPATHFPLLKSPPIPFFTPFSIPQLRCRRFTIAQFRPQKYTFHTNHRPTATLAIPDPPSPMGCNKLRPSSTP